MSARVQSRREFLATTALASANLGCASGVGAPTPQPRRARIAITLDLEMARNFPRWEDTHWDYEKGNLDDATKRYAVEAARRVKARGGVIHFFLVGRTLEQDNMDWLKELLAAGHRVGNHTYDHVYVKATKPADVQFRFQRAPWLIEGKSPQQAIRENIELCTAAMKSRLAIAPAGFRTPGGFANGLEDVPHVQAMLRELGFTWCSGKYPAHANSKPGEEPDAAVLDSIVKAQAAAQPFRYPGGLVEVPMSPISDVGAFRNGRWKLEWFLKALRLVIEWCITERAVFDFLGHPSCLSVMDPDFKAIDLMCDLTARAGNRAALSDLDTVAATVR
jgi:peptidoglycan/xylan/chitin deacetylase (PgdA/CDA1 family)